MAKNKYKLVHDIQIDYGRLKAVCLNPIKAFKPAGNVHHTKDGIYITNSHKSNKVLAIAHLDSVLGLKHFYINRIKGNDYIFNAQLDDRLGAYIILDLLPRMGLKYDILLTEGEESGRSTAFYFSPENDKQYNWMFSFDRHGDDVVMYQYDNDESRTLLKQNGFYPAIGSFSDISFLDHLDCIGFNFGTGYHNEHDPLCYMDSNMTRIQVDKFISFFNTYKNVAMPYTYSPRTVVYKGGFTRTYSDKFYFGDDKDYNGIESTCEICNGLLGEDDYDYECCESCAIDHGIYCAVCSKRISITEAINTGYCNKCLDDGEL